MTGEVKKQEPSVTTPKCLICSSQIKVSKRNSYGIFDKHVTEASGTALRAIIAKILEVEIKEDSVHSSVICKPCFRMLNEVDDMEVRTEELKKKINANYQESIRMLNEDPPEQCNNDRKTSLEARATDREQKIKKEACSSTSEADDATTEDVQENQESAREQETIVAEEGGMVVRDSNTGAHMLPTGCVPGRVYNMQVMADDGVPGEVYNIQVVAAVDPSAICADEVQQLVIYGGTDGECNENIEQIAVYSGPDSEGNENIQAMPVDRQHNENDQDMSAGDDADDSSHEAPADGNDDGDSSDDIAETEVAVGGGDDPDYVPNPEVDTDVKPLMKKKRAKVTVKKSNSQKESLPEKLVERDGIYFVCLLCTGDHKIMGDRKGILAHLKDIHGIRVYICDICLQYFTKRNELTEHLDNHVASEEGDFHCEVCNDVFHNIRLLEIHKRLHFPQLKLWSCETCGKSYGSRNMLEEHTNTHVGLRPYVCGDCGKTFASKYTYKSHTKIHEERERSFSCDQCGKSFYHAGSLKQHERTHNGKRNYVCEQCGKAFITARYLEVHSIVHTGYRPFACQICGKDFARRAEMINHERTHTGERPYQCEMCGATFGQRSNLQSHKRATHFQDKRYKCSLCDKGFKRQRLLDYHIKAAHTGERPYKCPTCSATFIYPHHFKKHMRLHMKKV